MPQLIQPADVVLRAKHPRPGAVVSRPSVVATWVRRCLARAVERRELAELSDWQLRDIGLTRTDVALEVRKRFWRD